MMNKITNNLAYVDQRHLFLNLRNTHGHLFYLYQIINFKQYYHSRSCLLCGEMVGIVVIADALFGGIKLVETVSSVTVAMSVTFQLQKITTLLELHH